MNPVLVTAPSTEPVTLQEAKDHLRISGSSEDTLITNLIYAARVQVENYLNRALITQTWDVFYDEWKNEMLLPYPPVQSVTSVKYYDLNCVQQTLSASNYWAVTQADPGSIVRKYETSWPELQYGRPSAIVVRIVAGYGDADVIPEPIKHAIKILLTDLYENRGSVVVGTNVTRNWKFVVDLIHQYKIYI